MNYEERHEIHVAVHEAGHAVASYYLLMPLKYSTIVRKGRIFGHTRQRLVRFDRAGVFHKSPRRRDRAERHILVALAGMIALGSYAPHSRWLRGSERDAAQAMQLFLHISDRDKEARYLYLALLLRRTVVLVNERWKDILAVARALVQRKTLSAEEIADLIRVCASTGRRAQPLQRSS